ncbi:hypothetical protein ATEIFO6365_0011019700 [Aspergillus terreus]|uniref:Uncharacterized protein n=1 Tax=Aspergillus terreus TaxID=33178 RepID=A0A5M3YZT3_ASPTE|nr:hypothetical protein ATETN484_0006019700 [Aspergillus terreus]GFF19938.1 hypothetical protein ATEIFO6365_0011019700 [Aspergillus terreus]
MPLTLKEKQQIWAQLPELFRLSKTHHTMSPSNSPFVLDELQVKKWDRFEQTVIELVRPKMSGKPNLLGPMTFTAESLAVANETDLQAHFCHHIGDVMSSIFAKAGFRSGPSFC